MSEAPEFVYLLGDSHVRSFANDPGFVPLFIGSGKQIRWTDDRLAQEATMRIAANLARIPREAPVILVFGEPDVRFTLGDAAEAQIDAGVARTKLVSCVARRTDAMKSLLRERLGVTAVYGCIPATSAVRNKSVGFYNQVLAAACSKLGVPFVDPGKHPICEHDRPVQPEYMADDIHLNARIVPVIRDALRRIGIEPRKYSGEFAWSDFIRFPVGDADTRIWGDAALASASPAYSASELRRQGAALVAALADRAGARTLLVVNAREGHVPLALPPQTGRVIVAFEPSAIRRRLMQTVLAVAARNDVRVLEPGTQIDPAPDVVVDLCGDGAAADLPMATASSARFSFYMRAARSATAAVVGSRFEHTGTVSIKADTKSGSHIAQLGFECRTAEDRSLVHEVARRLQQDL